MTHPSRIVALLVVVGASLLAACGGDRAANAATASDAFPLTVERCGHEATFEQPPERILVIGTEAFNMVVATGGGDRIVARAGAPAVPPDRLEGSGAEDAPELTRDDPSTEVILGAGVDTVLHYGMSQSSPEDLAAAGIVSLQVAGSCAHMGAGTAAVRWEDIYSDLELYGRLFGTEAQTADLVSGLQERVAAVEMQAEDRPPRTAAAFYFYQETPYVSGNQSMPHLQMQTLGLTNVYGEVDGLSAEVSIEELIDRDPDVLFLINYREQTFDDVKQGLLALPGAADLSAVRNDHIVGVVGLETLPDQTAIDGLEHMAQALERL